MSTEPLGILLISAGHERAHYAFVLASGAAALGRDVVIFATNQGCQALGEDSADFTAADAKVASLGVATLVELREAAEALGVRLIACEAGLRLSGLSHALRKGVEIAGVVTFLDAVQGGQIVTL
jgi:peroxiredoxin family protein